MYTFPETLRKVAVVGRGERVVDRAKLCGTWYYSPLSFKHLRTLCSFFFVRTGGGTEFLSYIDSRDTAPKEHTGEQQPRHREGYEDKITQAIAYVSWERFEWP